MTDHFAWQQGVHLHRSWQYFQYITRSWLAAIVVQIIIDCCADIFPSSFPPVWTVHSASQYHIHISCLSSSFHSAYWNSIVHLRDQWHGIFEIAYKWTLQLWRCFVIDQKPYSFGLIVLDGDNIVARISHHWVILDGNINLVVVFKYVLPHWIKVFNGNIHMVQPETAGRCWATLLSRVCHQENQIAESLNVAANCHLYRHIGGSVTRISTSLFRSRFKSMNLQPTDTQQKAQKTQEGRTPFAFEWISMTICCPTFFLWKIRFYISLNGMVAAIVMPSLILFFDPN